MTIKPLLILLGTTLVTLHCASTEESPTPSEPASDPMQDNGETADDPGNETDEDEDDPSATWPNTWEDIPLRYEFTCPTAPFSLKESKELSLKGQSFTALGSTLKYNKEKLNGPLRIGVVGALKDAAPGTRKNLKKAIKIFRKKKVAILLANGDLAEDEELNDVLTMLGEESPFPVFAFPGNIEWGGAFNHAIEKVQKTHPHVINMNWVRHLDYGGYHLVSIPGYHNSRFMRPGGCRYTDKHIDQLAPIVEKAQANGGIVILTSHGPPLSRGAKGIDEAEGAGNVGNPSMTEFIEKHNIRYGLFSHILEAGGRATSDLKSGKPIRFPMKKKSKNLYINAGSASSFTWTMLNGRPSRGMVAVVIIAEDGAKASIHRF